MKTITPIEKLNEYSTYLEDDGCLTYNDSDLLEIVTQATTQIEDCSGWDTESDKTPTASEILMAINNALYHHFNEESNK